METNSVLDQNEMLHAKNNKIVGENEGNPTGGDELSIIEEQKNSRRCTGNLHAHPRLSGLNTGWYRSQCICPCTNAGSI